MNMQVEEYVDCRVGVKDWRTKFLVENRVNSPILHPLYPEFLKLVPEFR
jgi:hypothetical protein